jgi:hypothetical protein
MAARFWHVVVLKVVLVSPYQTASAANKPTLVLKNLESRQILTRIGGFLHLICCVTYLRAILISKKILIFRALKSRNT